MAKSAHYLLGKRGEARALLYLEAAGYRIVDQNYSTPWGEIDIIAHDENVVCFVEVKTRSSNMCGFPAEAVTSAKQKKLVKTAMVYIEGNRKKGREFRFDLIEMFYDASCNDFVEINHILDAFIAE